MRRDIARACEISIDELGERAHWWRLNDKLIVFTNGCFDILHPGHFSFLQRAAGYGDVMIVGVNSDRSVRANKGPDRPILPLAGRIYALTCLRFVDYVVSFDEDTPEELIKRVRPYWLVKGDEYKEEEIVGRAHADNVLRLAMLKDWSTTDLIKKAGRIWSRSSSRPLESTSSSSAM